MSDNYNVDVKAQTLVASLVGHRIKGAFLVEHGERVVITLLLDDERTICIGVYGNLHDEAYLICEEDV